MVKQKSLFLIIASISTMAWINFQEHENVVSPVAAKGVPAIQNSSSNTKNNSFIFSKTLSPYSQHSTSRSLTADQILRNTADIPIKEAELNIRRFVVAMYKDFGIDISLDYLNNPSKQLLSLNPTHWSAQTPQPLSGNFVQPYSVDAPFYHPIPANTPRVALPANYINTFQYNTVKGGDGIGIGIAISSASDPIRRIRSQWYEEESTRKDYSMPVRKDAITLLPENLRGDQHLIFINSSTSNALLSYKVAQDSNGVDFKSLYSGGIQPLGSLGDKGGSVAANFSELAILVRPGEAISTTKPIPHAVGGPVRRVWKARVYPASAWDGFIDGKDPCSGNGSVNTGLVPYGGVIQLDPSLNFQKVPNSDKYQLTINGQTFPLSLPAYRVLQAMQTYGYYIADYGCADLDIYTNTNESEYANYGGSYGVQQQIQSVVTRAKLYVVPPIVKK
jgi:hypothetical protein